MEELQTRPWNPLELAQQVPLRQRRKYDWLLGDELLDVCVGRGVLDCDGAGQLLRDLSAAAGIRATDTSACTSDGGAVLTFTPGPAAEPSDAVAPTSPAYAKPHNPVEIIASQGAFAALCQRLGDEPILALDVETTIWDKPRLLCTVQLATSRQTWIVDVLALKDLGPIVPVLGSADITKIIHYADFEREASAGRGIAIQNIFDTCEMSRALRPAETGHSLADCVLRELGLRMDKSFQKADWKRRPLPQAMIDYAALDAEILVALHAKLSLPR